MDNINNTSAEGINTSTDGTQQGKTFTQDDVNRIVQDRLAKERAKADNNTDLAKREQDLVRREMNLTAREILTSKGLPVELCEALNCTDKETLEKSISVIEKVFNEYKANVTSTPLKISGITPAGSGSAKASAEDMNIRQAMGLSW